MKQGSVTRILLGLVCNCMFIGRKGFTVSCLGAWLSRLLSFLAYCGGLGFDSCRDSLQPFQSHLVSPRVRLTVALVSRSARAYVRDARGAYRSIVKSTLWMCDRLRHRNKNSMWRSRCAWYGEIRNVGTIGSSRSVSTVDTH